MMNELPNGRIGRFVGDLDALLVLEREADPHSDVGENVLPLLVGQKPGVVSIHHGPDERTTCEGKQRNGE